MKIDDTLNIISQQWCNLEDLMFLANVGRNNALKIKSKIRSDLLNNGYFVPKNSVPMTEVIKYLNIDIDYLESRKNYMKGDDNIA